MGHTYTKVFGWFIWNWSLTGCPVLSLVMSDGRRPFQASTSRVLVSALLPKLVLQANILLPNFPNLQRLSPLFSLFMGPSAQSWSFLNGSLGNESTCNARDIGDVSLIPGLGISPGGGNGNPLQYSCLKNPKDRGPWQARVQGVAKSWKWLKQLSPRCPVPKEKSYLEFSWFPASFCWSSK